jgi:hypothetical protein
MMWSRANSSVLRPVAVVEAAIGFSEIGDVIAPHCDQIEHMCVRLDIKFSATKGGANNRGHLLSHNI